MSDNDSSPSYRYYEEYTLYARTLRNWLMAYGIGGPIVYLTQQKVPEAVAKSGDAPAIAILFLIGVALQIFSALLYKAATWKLHYTNDLNPNEETPDWVIWVEKNYWIDVITDIATIACFAVATTWIFCLIGSAASG